LMRWCTIVFDIFNVAAIAEAMRPSFPILYNINVEFIYYIHEIGFKFKCLTLEV
jgi:hypothetical protein